VRVIQVMGGHPAERGVLGLMSEIKTIIQVEDDADVAEMCRTLFEDCPVNWVIAPTGAEGLRMARELQPDLVVLDLMLPDLPGREVFLQMQADPQLKHIPVWVLSVIWWNANLFPWHEPAIVSYTFKPFEPYEFRDRVLRLLGMNVQ
jgi:two-component system OmpR family response regulator